MTGAVREKLRATDQGDVASAARALAAGCFVIHAFANVYALTTRGDAATVRAANLFKAGRWTRWAA